MFSAPKQGVTVAETTAGGGHRSGGSHTVTVEANPSVEQVQTYMTKSPSPSSYVPSSSEFDFMSSTTLGSPSGTHNNSNKIITSGQNNLTKGASPPRIDALREVT